MKLRHLFVTVPLTVMALSGIGCAASPEDVCKHIMNLMEKEMGEMPEEAKKAMKEKQGEAIKECVKGVEKEKEKIGYMKYRKQSRCIMDASKAADLAKCKE